MDTQYLPRTAKFNRWFRTATPHLSRVLLVALCNGFSSTLGGAYKVEHKNSSSLNDRFAQSSSFLGYYTVSDRIYTNTVRQD
ncbi:hypothetical protein N7451_005851 [Penicillium sp. IBT 35674x]|uniref:Uncharacterized protein n=1 Tax=Penicillium diatomitis TaxID=2819901 RepID=A0A9X0BNR7_9EURO|nr:uncharacterized protein N7539_007950 [Penicillium diatomitis]KAJ5475663.1 hypothetical protein N7539_007950 [Penicillium diatomitis]KAJ6003304.1 hypothetical protein N7451_005851 [Penicillium sp. IBT 35674x]KAJ6134489.1 hypothetical protein N7523_000811 [Penicillium sp. IBT 18751x]